MGSWFHFRLWIRYVLFEIVLFLYLHCQFISSQRQGLFSSPLHLGWFWSPCTFPYSGYRWEDYYFQDVKQSESGANHSFLCIVEVEDVWSYQQPNSSSWCGAWLTLLWYHKKSYVNSTMGSLWPHCKKKPEYKYSLLQCSFPQNNISQHKFVLKYRQIGTTLS
jgi:hypothetical protein